MIKDLSLHMFRKLSYLTEEVNGERNSSFLHVYMHAMIYTYHFIDQEETCHYFQQGRVQTE